MIRRLVIAVAIAAVLGGLVALYAPPWLAAGWLALALAPLLIAAGALGLDNIHALSGGAWGEPIAAPLALLECGWIPGFAMLLPLLLAPASLFPWVAADSELPWPAWFGVDALALRSLGYLAGFCLVHWLTLPRRAPQAGAALIVWLPLLSFLVIDWIGGRMPQFASSGFGLTCTGLALLLALSTVLLFATPSGSARADLGNLLLGAILFWAYVTFMEFIIVWEADLPHEAAFYRRRADGWTGALTIAFVLFAGAIPFGLLLFRGVKARLSGLRVAAGSTLFGGLLHLLWLVAPGVLR